MSQLTPVSSDTMLRRATLRMKKQLHYDWIISTCGALWRVRAIVLPNYHEDGSVHTGITFSVTLNGDASDRQYSLYFELSPVDNRLTLNWSSIVPPPSKRDLCAFEGIYPIGYLLTDIIDCAKPFPIVINIPILPAKSLRSLEA